MQLFRAAAGAAGAAVQQAGPRGRGPQAAAQLLGAAARLAEAVDEPLQVGLAAHEQLARFLQLGGQRAERLRLGAQAARAGDRRDAAAMSDLRPAGRSSFASTAAVVIGP